jgi:hypothetical protein
LGQSVLPNEFPAVGKNHQDPNGGVDHLRTLDQFAVQDPQEATAACDPRPLVVLKKKRDQRRGAKSIPFPPTATVCEGWVQSLRTAHKTAVPIFDGRLTDEFDEHDEKFVKR